MKKFVIVAVVAAQVAVLAWMAAEREWVLHTGRAVYLRTEPVDPQDPMRGDYVRLNYEIARVPKALCSPTVAAWCDAAKADYRYKDTRDRRVYAEIRLSGEAQADLVALSDRPPSTAPYLKGRTTAIDSRGLQVRFGVEALFMQQGKAKEFEDRVRHEKAGVPLNMELAVGSNGLAVLKGYRWEPLGITLVLDRISPTNPGARDREAGLRGLTVELKNHGDAPQAIVDAPAARTLRLIPANAPWATNAPDWVWVGEKVPPSQLSAEDLKILAPGETHRVHLDFADASWFVRKSEKGIVGEPTPIPSLGNDWSASFRIEYAPPSAATCAGLPNAALIRHSNLRSRRFSAAGGND